MLIIRGGEVNVGSVVVVVGSVVKHVIELGFLENNNCKGIRL